MEAKDIKELRASMGLTQEQFARVVGVAYFTVIRWENNMCRPNPLAVKRLKSIKEKVELGKRVLVHV